MKKHKLFSKRAFAVIMALCFLFGLFPAVGSRVKVDAAANSGYFEFNLSGFKKTLPYGQLYHIPGSVTSNGNMILEINARVIDAASGQYNATATYYNGFVWKGVNLSGVQVKSTVTLVGDWTYPFTGHKIDNEIHFAGLRKGNYYFEVKVTDTSYRTATKRIAFSVK